MTFNLFLIAIIAASSLAASDLIDQYAEKTLQEWEIPGLSLAIVRKGETIKIQGYGYKERGQLDPVNTKTTFQIASLTKAFTGLTAAMLVEEHKLDWDTPVRSYAPDLHFKDSMANEKMTLTDLLSHKTGLPGISRGECDSWYRKDCKPDDLIALLPSIEPSFPFRSHFSYSNLAYVAASHVMENVISLPWDAFCKERIFDPLQMTRTHFSYERFLEDENRAEPHHPPKEQIAPITPLNWNSLKAAAGIYSCAEDLAKWMNHCLFSVGRQSPVFARQTLVDPEEFVGKENLPEWSVYSHGQEIVYCGLGWMMYELAGRTVFFHVGCSDGMYSALALVPEETLGIAVLTNQSSHLGHFGLLNQLLDLFLIQ